MNCGCKVMCDDEENLTDMPIKFCPLHDAMLNGKLITNEELYKQPTDYIKEARAAALEEAAQIADPECHGGCNHMHYTGIATKIRALAKETK